MNKRCNIAATALLAGMMVTAPAFAAENEGVTGFNSFPWKTSYDEVTASEIKDGMREGVDYVIDQEDWWFTDIFEFDGLTYFLHITGSVAGHDANTYYIFDEDGLCAGFYDVLDMEEEDYLDLVGKLEDIYGEPVRHSDSTGWGASDLWIDEDGDIVLLSDFEDKIVYAKPGTEFFDSLLDETVEKYYGFNLRDLVEQNGNHSGL